MTDLEMPLGDYDAILARQRGGCAICEKKSRKKLLVYRCQSTGMVRGLLCHKCLTFLECFDFDPNLILAAAKYRAAHTCRKADSSSPHKIDQAQQHRSPLRESRSPIPRVACPYGGFAW